MVRLFRRRKKVTPETQFPMAQGRHYFSVLQDLHKAITPEWYLEIGVQEGKSLRLSSANTVGVDPEPKFSPNDWDKASSLYLFAETSDDFFANKHLDDIGCRFQLAFLDGMHLYEFLLRDFFNTERYMDPSGVIVLHDCLPWSENMAHRDRSQVDGPSWTGDVWKVVPILKKFRPDLSVRILDAAPTGLVVIDSLDPNSTVLADKYDQILAEQNDNTDLATYLEEITIESVKRRVLFGSSKWWDLTRRAR